MNTFPKKIVISGQTHGNEWTGTYVVNHLQSLNLAETFPNIDIKLILSNPEAFKAGTRYVDQDLNRSFGKEKDNSYESKRSTEIEDEIRNFSGGEKILILDLHTTTADMGSSLVMHSLREENVALFAHLKTKTPHLEAYAWIEPNELKFLNSLSDYGFAIEVGPIAGATLDAHVYEQTLTCVMDALTFLNDPSKYISSIPESEAIHVFKENVDYPRDSDGNPSAMIASEFKSKNFSPIKPGDPIFQDFSLNKITKDEYTDLIPVFINEAAYYEKNIAFTLTEKKPFPTG